MVNDDEEGSILLHLDGRLGRRNYNIDDDDDDFGTMQGDDDDSGFNFVAFKWEVEEAQGESNSIGGNSDKLNNSTGVHQLP